MRQALAIAEALVITPRWRCMLVTETHLDILPAGTVAGGEFGDVMTPFAHELSEHLTAISLYVTPLKWDCNRIGHTPGLTEKLWRWPQMRLSEWIKALPVARVGCRITRSHNWMERKALPSASSD